MPEKLPLSYEPAEAADIISFDGQAVVRQSYATTSRCLVATPGSVSAARPGPDHDDFDNELVSGLTESIKALDWKKAANSQNWTYNSDKAVDLYLARLQDVSSTSRSSLRINWSGPSGASRGSLMAPLRRCRRSRP